jgi:hypothetical protein
VSLRGADSFEFDGVVFFGRRLDEYVKMFDLKTDAMVGRKILDCAAGPAAFAVQAAELGISVVACDPMYELDSTTLRTWIDKDARMVGEKQAKTPQFFHHELEPTSRRREDMELFLADFEHGKSIGRYVAGRLPNLPFADASFDFVLSGNLLFLYSDPRSGGMMEGSPFDYAFHSRAIAELLRIARQEVRIYPLQGPNVKSHAYLSGIIAECQKAGCKAEVVPVPQRDIIGAENMLRIAH